MVLRIILAIALLVPAACGAREKEETALPFVMPVPEGWRTETIPFPLGFALELEYEGLEELRFAPGMFEEGKEDFWTYAFVWWIPEDSPVDPESLASGLEIYFSGLAGVVAETRGFDTDGASYEVTLMAADTETAYDYEGSAKILEPFVTGKMISLNIRIKQIACPEQEHMAVFFELSPQPYSHDIWSSLAGIREGFRCGETQK